MNRIATFATPVEPLGHEPLRPVLIVLHQEHSQPGRVGNALRKLGYTLDIRRPRFGDPLPETMEGHAGAIVFGGPMSANDGDDYIKREIGWIGVPLKEQRPYLGICLGAQMMARHLGARVSIHPEGKVEVGYYPIRPTAAGLALCPEWPAQVYQWHKEGFELPAGCDLLAEGGDFPIQAMRCGTGFGIQFHPDITYAMMHRWTVRAHERLTSPGAQTRADHFAARLVHDPAEHRWLRNFLLHWLAEEVTFPVLMAAE